MTLPVVHANPRSLVRLFSCYEEAVQTLNFYQLKPVPKGFVNLTPYVVSNAMSALLSYGPKFMLPTVTNVLDIVDDFGKLYSYLQKTYGILDPSQIFLELFHNHRREVNELLKGRRLGSVELALKYAMEEVHNFFKLHPDTCLVQSDKGNKTCLMLCLDYRVKMQEYVDRSLSEGVYVMAGDTHMRVAVSSFLRLRKDLSEILDKTPWASRIPKKLYDSLMSTRVSSATVPVLYGMVKCHKDNAPMRPICSTLHWLSRPIQKLLLWVLRDYFSDRMCQENVVRIDEVARDIMSLRVRSGYCLAKFDICNMYGSLDKEKIARMLKLFLASPEIAERAVLSADMVLRLFHFSMHLSPLVSYGGMTYKQTKGLPQGACDSGFLATLYLDTILQVHNEELFQAHKVVRFWKYMDDMLLYLPMKLVPCFRNTFERITGLELDLELQSSVDDGPLFELGVRRTISFLDIRINTMEDGTLTTSAYRKPTSSARMIHSLSSTIMDYKLNALSQYLRTILRRSSNEFLMHDYHALYARALENSYPSSLLDHQFYKVLENERSTLLKGVCYLNLRTHLLQARIEIITTIIQSLHCGDAELIQELREQHVSLTPLSRVVFPYRSVSMSRLLRLGCIYGGIPLPVYSRSNQSGYLARYFANRRLSTLVEVVSGDCRFFCVGFVKCIDCDMVFILSGRNKLDKLADLEFKNNDGEIVRHQNDFGHLVSPVVHRLRNISNVDVAYTDAIYKALFNSVGVSCGDQQLLSQVPIYIRCLLGYMQGLGHFDVVLPPSVKMYPEPLIPVHNVDVNGTANAAIAGGNETNASDEELCMVLQQNESNQAAVLSESMQPLLYEEDEGEEEEEKPITTSRTWPRRLWPHQQPAAVQESPQIQMLRQLLHDDENISQQQKQPHHNQHNQQQQQQQQEEEEDNNKWSEGFDIFEN